MDNHQHNAQQDAVFIRNFGLVFAGLFVIGIIVAILARTVYSHFLATTHIYEGDLDSRIAPVGAANTSGSAVVVANPGASADAAPAAAPAAPASGPGEATYNKVCFACHAQGIAGAPKFKDAAAWEPRIAKGVDTLYKHALEGFQGEAGIMPPKGGGADIPDADIKAAVDFMVKAAQGGDAAPVEAPAPAAAATPAAAPAAADATAAATPMVAAAGDKGKQVFDAVCFACHTPGAAGAPKFGDATAWAPRIAKGMDTLYEHSLNGFMGEAGLMPPKGGRPDFADADIKAAVDYMTANSK